jgi:hypothetical protein
MPCRLVEEIYWLLERIYWSRLQGRKNKRLSRSNLIKFYIGSYVYWNVHHLDSWIKIDQPDVICFIVSLFNAQHVSNVSTSILRSLRLICWVISLVWLLWFDVCWCYGVVRLGWCGILMHKCFSFESEQYNPWNNSTNKLQAPEDGCTNIRKNVEH